METRMFGRTGHLSTVAIFGAAAFWNVTQPEADRVMEQVIAAGINHIDVAPSYGLAEERIGPWMPAERSRFFLGCKTMERSRDGALAEMERSLKRLQVDQFDLYQIHAITTLEELDAATQKGGALEGILEAQAAGLTRHIGITGHGLQAPALFLEGLRRFRFDSVLFPLNARMYAEPDYRRDAEALIAECKEQNVGTMVIKTITKGPWGDQPKTHTTWYEPFDDAEKIQNAVNFALSQDISGLCTAGDIRVLPLVLDACQRFTTMSESAQLAYVQAVADLVPLFT